MQVFYTYAHTFPQQFVHRHDTTAMSMIWTLFLLGHHPEYQERVQQEIDEIWDRDQVDDSKFLNSNQLREMKFLEACIKESLRLFPRFVLFYCFKMQ